MSKNGERWSASSASSWIEPATQRPALKQSAFSLTIRWLAWSRVRSSLPADDRHFYVDCQLPRALARQQVLRQSITRCRLGPRAFAMPKQFDRQEEAMDLDTYRVFRSQFASKTVR